MKHALQYLTFVGAMHDVPCFSEEMSRKEHKNIMHTTNEDRVFVIVAPKPVQTPSMECEYIRLILNRVGQEKLASASIAEINQTQPV